MALSSAVSAGEMALGEIRKVRSEANVGIFPSFVRLVAGCEGVGFNVWRTSFGNS